MAKHRQRTRGPAPIAGLLGKFSVPSAATKAPPPIDELTWRRIVGVGVAARSQPASIQRGTLWVHVVSSAWAQELSLLQVTLLERLATHGHRVDRIRFRIGAITPATLRTKLEAPVPPRAKLPENVCRALAELADEQLRAVIAEAATVNLAWEQGYGPRRQRFVPDLRTIARARKLRCFLGCRNHPFQGVSFPVFSIKIRAVETCGVWA